MMSPECAVREMLARARRRPKWRETSAIWTVSKSTLTPLSRRGRPGGGPPHSGGGPSHAGVDMFSPDEMKMGNLGTAEVVAPVDVHGDAAAIGDIKLAGTT